MKRIASGLLATTLGLTLPALADDLPGHYEGKPAETLDQAVTNFSQYNVKLAEILDKPELSSRDLHEIHQITYTLENALYRLEEEVEELAEVLEEVHVASENADAETVQSKGRDYLETSRKIIK
jgi:hypothetical protein